MAMNFGGPQAAPYTTPRPELPPPGYGGRQPTVGPRPGPPGTFTPIGTPRPGALQPMGPHRAARMGAGGPNALLNIRGGGAGMSSLYGMGPQSFGGGMGAGASLGFGNMGGALQPMYRGVPR